MFEKTIETSATPHITVTECLGDLVVRGAEEPRIVLRLQNGADEASLEREGESFTLAARADCTITCPWGATLTVSTVRGNLRVKEVQGTVAIGAVNGDTTLRAVGPTAVEQTFGDLNARQVAGNLQVQEAKGNVRIRGVEGLLSLDQVGGNLVAEGLQGGLAAGQIRGNARLKPPFSPGAAYRLNASGNLTVRLPTDANLSLALRASGAVRSHVPDLVLEEADGKTTGVVGTGEANLEAEVGGQVYLQPAGSAEPFDFAFDLEGLGAQIETQINAALAEIATRLEESLSRVDSEDIRRRVERTTEKARLKAEQAAERARLRAERAERRWQRASGHKRRSKRRDSAATDEERLRILRLVEEGKVAPEQAADLLAALEGR